MRIALSGVPGTGKTTFGNFLGKHTSLEYLPETEDVVLAEMGFTSIKDLIEKRDVEGLLDNFFISLDRKITEETNKDDYVTDKSLFDVGARWFGRLWEGTTPEQHEHVREAMQQFSDEKVYDRIIYLPLHLNRDVEDDGLRTIELERRYQRSLILQGLFKEYEISVEHYEFNFSDSPEKVISELGLERFRR